MAADNDNNETDTIKQTEPSEDTGDKKSPKQPEQLEDITVQATRVEKPSLLVPAAVGTINKDDIQLGRQQLGLDESLNKIPGLFFQDRYNFSQDLRIAIRGFGARSNFGIRGIKIYSDGIPLTTPDGQSNVDEIDLGSTQRIEVIRGPSSSLYGSSSGGVINLYSEDGPEVPFVSGQFAYGSYDYQNYQLKTGGLYDKFNYLFNASRLNLDGFRDHSKVESNNLTGKVRYDIDPSSSVTFIANDVYQPISDDPGALTAAEVVANRKQAAPRNLAYDAGESVDQQKFGWVYKKQIDDKQEIVLRNYYVWRDFASKLPAGGGGALGNSPSINGRDNAAWVQFQRLFLGGGGQYIYTDNFFGHNNRFTAGFDIDSQIDDRQRFNNDLGLKLPGVNDPGPGDPNCPAGSLCLDQTENVLSRGFFLQDEFTIVEHLELTAGARYDMIDYNFVDHLLNDPTGDDSAKVNYDKINPMAGLLWSPVEQINLYGRISTAFETPSTTEFANPAGGGFAGGLNASLKPQTATNYEVGIKGLFRNPHVLYDIAVFQIDTENEFIPFTLTSAPAGRTFSENAKSTNRRGLEAAVAWQPVRGLTASFAYTYSNFTFDKFTSTKGGNAAPIVVDGNTLPGIPDQQFHVDITYYHPSGFYCSWDMLYVGQFYANNTNTIKNDAYHIANLRVGHQFNIAGWEISPFLGLNNMFDEKYNGNVRLNASDTGAYATDIGGRFFEPAPSRNIYGGLTAVFNFE